MQNDYIAMIVTHLNAPYGNVVQRENLEAAFRCGTFSAHKCSDLEDGLLHTLFTECMPAMIGRACLQTGASLQRAQDLYKETLAVGMPRAMRWEDGVKDAVDP